MKIAAISNCPLERTQGSGRVILGFAERVRAAGHEVVCLDPREITLLPWMHHGRRLRLVIGCARAAQRAIRGGCDILELWGVETWLTARLLFSRKRRPALVHRSNGLEPAAWAALAPARTPKTPFDGIRHLLSAWEQPQDAFRRVDAMTTVSLEDRRFALACGYLPQARILALPNALEPSWLGRPPPGTRKPHIAWLGSWIERKGIAAFEAALPRVLHARPAARARLLGIGRPALEVLERFPAGVRERIEIFPTLPHAEVRKHLDECAILAFPSLYEGFGLALAEAMACGCAAVTTATGFGADLRHGVEALIVPRGDPVALEDALLRLIDDSSACCAIARAGWSRVQSLRWEPIVQNLLVFYESLQRDRSR